MAVPRKRKSRFEAWYQHHQPHYDELAKVCKHIIEKVLKEHKIPVLSVSARGKSVISAVKKARDKDYRMPKKDMTDLAGIRVITYTESDAERAAEIVKKLFCVDAKRSGDKTESLSKDKVGYRSIHFVCAMNEDRLKLPEFEKFSGKLFEIQVRTVLQHAWAEIEHSRSYKFSGVLPPKLERSLFLTAGLLEVADKQLAQLASAIDQYRAETRAKAKKGNFKVSLNTLSVQTFLKSQKFPVQFKLRPTESHEQWVQLLAECEALGVRSLRDLRRLMSKEFWTAFQTVREKSGLKTLTEAALVRRLLIFGHFERMLQAVAEKLISEETVWLLALKYTDVEKKVTQAGLSIFPIQGTKDIESQLEKLEREAAEKAGQADSSFTNTDGGEGDDDGEDDFGLAYGGQEDDGPSQDDGPAEDDNGAAQDDGPSDEDEGPAQDDGPADDDGDTDFYEPPDGHEPPRPSRSQQAVRSKP